MNKINIFDCDGVICMGTGASAPVGLRPTSKNDIIVTGRSFEEAPETIKWLRKNDIFNLVLFNPIKFKDKTRETSGKWKALAINNLKSQGFKINYYYEDDIVQYEIVMKEHPELSGVLITHDFTEKDNISHK